MTHVLPRNQIDELRQCLDLVYDPQQHEVANQQFTCLLEKLSADAQVHDLVKALWQEVLSARRSVEFWHQMNQVEKQMTDHLAKNHVQLKQNYLRLMREM